MPAAAVSPYWPLEPTTIQRISTASSSSVAVGNAARKSDDAETALVSKRLMMWLQRLLDCVSVVPSTEPAADGQMLDDIPAKRLRACESHCAPYDERKGLTQEHLSVRGT